jgi:gliding motility-associated-like protein
MVVHVRDVLASFSFPQPTVCVNVPSSYNAAATVDAYLPSCGIWKYLWYFDNLPPEPTLGPLMYHAFNTVGTHSVSLYVKDENSCTSTLTKTIGVSGPVIQFSANPNPVCASDGTVQFVNNTTNLPDPITGYYWNFGNGNSFATVTNTVPLQIFTAVTPFSNYTVALTATNSIGCIDTKTLLLQVNKPDATFFPSQQNICLSGNSSANITFSSAVSYPSYTYDYGTPSNPTLSTSSNITSHSFGVGSFTVKVTVKDNQGCQNTSSMVINAAQTPTADFTYLSSPPALKPNAICAPATMTFINISSPQSSTYTPNWDLGGGFGQVVSQNTVSNSFSSLTNTVVPISVMVTTGAPNYCQSTVTKNFNLYVVKANVALTNSIVCLGGSIKFSIDTTQGAGVLAWVWDFGDLSLSPTVTAFPTPPASTVHVYSTYPASTAGNTTVSLIYYSSDYACAYYDARPIRVVKVDADFQRNNEAQRFDSIHCPKIPDLFHNVAFPGNPSDLSYQWDFPGGVTASGSQPSFTFPNPGVYQVTLTVTDNSTSCTGKAVRNMTILPLPTASISTGLYCPDRPFPITASLSPGAVSGTWTPASGIVGVPTFTTLTGTFTSTGTISKSSSYYLNVTDTNNCVSDTVKMMINILPPPPVVRWDTTVIIGQPIPINGNVGNFTYTWSPVTTDLSCTLCPNPVSTSTVNITYSVNVEDLQKCAVVTSTYNVIIEPKTSVDVPTAFTPTGDGTNDIIYVGGWGIRKLNYFRIYNRWGQLLFETHDIKIGWDGTFQGLPQNMETYVYQVSVETMVEGRILDKTSTFKLLR